MNYKTRAVLFYVVLLILACIWVGMFSLPSTAQPPRPTPIPVRPTLPAPLSLDHHVHLPYVEVNR